MNNRHAAEVSLSTVNTVAQKKVSLTTSTPLALLQCLVSPIVQ